MDNINNKGLEKLNIYLRDRIASVLTDIFNPPFIMMIALAAIAHQATRGMGDFIKWWLMSSLFVGVVPILITLRGMNKGWITDRHITIAQQRMKPFVVVASSMVVCAVALLLLSAPPEILAGVLSALGVLLVGLLLTPRFKFSMHCGSIAGSATVVALLYGSWAIPFILLVPIIGWARVEIAHHTISQVVLGSIIGSGVAGFIFTLVT